ncbi:beta-Tubulin at 97EF [Carabus blaptoides fortunei]
MSEFITIQVGQCGNQIGSAFWPLVLQEYSISNVPGGIARRNAIPTRKIHDTDSFYSFFSANENFNLNTILKYSDLRKFNVKARAILIDMEDSVVDRYHNGPLKCLFDKTCTIKNFPGSGNNWAEGYLTHGSKYRSIIENILRRSVEMCNGLHGFLLMYSVGGGTGSGLGSYVLQLLEELYPNIDRFVTCVYPNGTEDVITCPYNMALATKSLTNHATCVFPIENRQLLDIVNKQRSQKECVDTLNYIIKCKPFQDMNTIIVNMLLHLTSSVSPITVSYDHCRKQRNGRKIHNDIFVNCCSRKNQLLKLDPLGTNSVLIGAALIGRGDFIVSDMRDYVDQIQNRARFTPWSKNAIKIGLCGVPPVGHDSSMLTLFNSSAMCSLFTEVQQQFTRLYNKKAHVHHYTKIEGFETTFFDECNESLLRNIENYSLLNRMRSIYRPRFTVL